MNTIIIVPYRNRAEHLTIFLRHMSLRYPDFPICIVEQSKEKPFNRAKLLNIGFLENRKYEYFIFHDVDMLPINANYIDHNTYYPVQLAKSEIQKVDYLGGVTLFSEEIFKYAGGYNNEYFHRAEDNEMRFNLKILGISVIEKPQTFTTLSHERKGLEFDPALWKKAQIKRTIQNQLRSCKYEIINEKTLDNIKQITVSI